MIKEIRLENWKSFKEATLYIDPFTVLIGTNASGKSNILDALQFLQRIGSGLDAYFALEGNEVLPALRGGLNAVSYQKAESLKITVTCDIYNVQFELSNQSTIEAKYEVLVSPLKLDYDPDIEIEGSLNYESEKEIFEFLRLNDKVNSEYSSEMELYAGLLANSLKEIYENTDQIEQYNQYRAACMKDYGICRKIDSSFFKYTNIQIFEIKPDKIRNYSRLSKKLLSDASNLAGFIAALSTDTKENLEQTLTEYLSRLPQKDIKRVWTELVKPLEKDAMLYCEEEWIDGQTQIIDAQSMSDGTLRFIAILTALLTCPEGSLIAIEEVDTGLHPSRMRLLIEAIDNIGQQRNVDVLVTTHNPALLDGLPPDMMPFVQVVHRDSETGASCITPLDDIQQLPKLLASGSLGKVTTRGELEQSLQTQD